MELSMKLSAVLDLFNESQSPNDWLRVNDQNGDGGFTMVCKQDVLLCLSIKLVWVKGKPFTRIQVAYGSTILSWADLPVTASEVVKDHSEILAAAKRALGGS
jgi:hypothetical protein